MSKAMTVTDAHLRLDQLKNGRIPSKETPVLGNPIYQKAYTEGQRPHTFRGFQQS